jgi:serralysin
MPTSTETALGADAPNSAASLFQVALGGWAHGSISTAGDADFIAVDLVAGQSYSFAMVGIGADALRDPYLRLYGPDGVSELLANDNGLANGHAILQFTAPTSGRYFLQASAVGGLTGSYAVAATIGALANFDAAMAAGILDSHLSWSPSRGAGVMLSYGFSDTISHDLQGFAQFTPEQMELTRAILAQFADVAGVSFVEVNPGGYTDAATLLYGNFNDSAAADFAGSGPGDAAFGNLAGDVFINTHSYTLPAETPGYGSADALMMLRLIGQSLGLSAPGLYDAPGPLGYATHADFVQDSAAFTVMSPFGAQEAGASPLIRDTLGIHDIAALQLIYGANLTTRAGNDTYGFGATAGAVYDFDLNIDPMVTIWDAGGSDTLDLSRYSGAQNVDLTPGSLSSIGGYQGNLGIAYGTVIEHAIGGRGADQIIGNDAANLLRGGAGRDTLYGGTGHDTLQGGSGSDTLYGGAGNDLLRGDDSAPPATPPPSFALITTNAPSGAVVQASGVDLFPLQSFTLELLWQQQSSTAPGPAARFGNLVLHRHADGSGSIEFEEAAVDPILSGILPAALFDGDLHRLTLTYDDTDGRFVVYLDGVRVADRMLIPGTRGLPPQGDVSLGDQVGYGDIRLFDYVRSAQEVWDTAWISLPNPGGTGGLLQNWQAAGGAGMTNALPAMPDLLASGAVGTASASFETVNTGNYMAGGAGNDTYEVYHSGDRVIEAAGGGSDRIDAYANHTLFAGSEVEAIYAMGSAGRVLTGNALANRFISNAAHADTLAGGAGNDTYVVYNSGDRVIEAAGGGSDRIDAYANHTLFAGSEVEAIYAMGSAGRVLTGNALANRFISNAAHADTLTGGAGNDTYVVYHAGDRVIETAGGGTDRIDAYANHTLFAGSEVEAIHAMGSAGRVLTGNALANRFISNAAHADTLTGGAGNDTYVVYNAGDRVIEAAGGGSDRIDAYANHTLFAGSEVEAIHAMGSAGRVLTGNALANRFISNAAHADTLAGGAGNDTYVVYNSGDRVIEAAGGGTDRIDAFANHTLFAGSEVEAIYAMGSAGRVLTGNALANRFISNAARADTLAGGAGNDTYYLRNSADRVIEASAAGRDVIYTNVHYRLAAGMSVEQIRAEGTAALRLIGNELSNQIYGNAGRNVLEGGRGFDRLYGGADSVADRFVFRTTSDSAVGTRRDVVHQFQSGIDKIDLRPIDANLNRTGNQAFTYSDDGPEAFGLWAVRSTKGLILRMDNTGDARANSEILLSGVASVQIGDFLL